MLINSKLPGTFYIDYLSLSFLLFRCLNTLKNWKVVFFFYLNKS